MPAGKLVENVSKFAGLLHRAGMPVSTTEVMDALTAVSLVDMTDRAQVRAALRATLVKNPLFLPAFEAAFADYFRPPEAREARVQEHLSERKARAQEFQQVRKELSFQGQPLDLPAADQELYRRLRPEDQERIAGFVSKTSTGHNVDARFKPLVERLVHSHLSYWRHRLPLAEAGMAVEATGDPETDALLEDLLDQYAHLLYTDLQSLEEADLPQAARVVRQLSRQLATQLSRRYRFSRQARQLDIRRTIRSNITHGGTMVKLKYRQRKTAKPRLVFLGDVSGSMHRYIPFVLEFMAGLAASVRSVEAFLFAERFSRMDPVRGSDPLPELRARVEEKKRLLGQETKMDVALAGLLADYHDLLTKSTLAILIKRSG